MQNAALKHYMTKFRFVGRSWRLLLRRTSIRWSFTTTASTINGWSYSTVRLLGSRWWKYARSAWV